MALRTSSNGKLLYIYQAGNTIDLYEAAPQVPAHDHARRGHDDGLLIVRAGRAAQAPEGQAANCVAGDVVDLTAASRRSATSCPTGGGWRSSCRPEPGQHRAVAGRCRTSRRTLIDRALVGRDLAALYRDRRAVRGVARPPASCSTPSAGCGTRACRRTSCSTCGSRSTGTCSACRRGSTRGRRSATSWPRQQRRRRDPAGRGRVAARLGGQRAVPGRQRRRDAAGSTRGCALVGVALVPLSVWALSRYARSSPTRASPCARRAPAIGSFLIETLQGMRLVVTSNAQQREGERFAPQEQRVHRALMSMQLWATSSGGVPGLILSLGSTRWCSSTAGSRVISGTLTLGAFVAFMAYQMRLFQPIQALMGLYASLATAQRVAGARARDPRHAAGSRRAAASPTRLDAVARRRRVRERHARLGRGSVLLDGVASTSRAGETLAIVGPSGSGKSTIADLLLRLLDPDAGVTARRPRSPRTVASRICGVTSCWSIRSHSYSMRRIAENMRYARPEATQRKSDAARAGGHRRIHRAGCRRDTTPRSASAEPRFRPASGSASRSPARCWPIPRCWCSTSRPASLDPVKERRCWPATSRVPARPNDDPDHAPPAPWRPRPTGCSSSPIAASSSTGAPPISRREAARSRSSSRRERFPPLRPLRYIESEAAHCASIASQVARRRFTMADAKGQGNSRCRKTGILSIRVSSRSTAGNAYASQSSTAGSTPGIRMSETCRRASPFVKTERSTPTMSTVSDTAPRLPPRSGDSASRRDHRDQDILAQLDRERGNAGPCHR